jgi:glycosyltransferase involved in cell wall biosynthesis
MNTISACMIVRNEETLIYNTLNTISEMFNEIIIVDTGSTDNTLNEIKRFTSQLNYGKVCTNIKLHQFEWCDSYSAARNYSYQFATCDYVTWWDADDVPGINFKEVMYDIRNNRYPGAQVFYIPTVTEFNEDKSPKNWITNDRIILKELVLGWQYPIHEQIVYKDLRQLNNQAFISFKPTICRIDHFKELKNNPRHLEFYNKLISNNHEFIGHDYYFYVVELINNELYHKIDEWVKLGCSKNHDNHQLGYFVMIYHRLKNEGHLQNLNSFIDIILLLLRHGICDAEVCCWYGDYLLSMNKYDAALMWYRNALNNQLEGAMGTVPEKLKFSYPINQIKLINSNYSI